MSGMSVFGETLELKAGIAARKCAHQDYYYFPLRRLSA